LKSLDRWNGQRVNGLLGWKLSASRQQQQQAHPHAKNIASVVREASAPVKWALAGGLFPAPLAL
jgi:hypothetical protein